MIDIELAKWKLSELSNQEEGGIESNEIEVLGEDSQGRDAYCTLKITSIAEDALKAIESIERNNDDLIKDIATEFFYHWRNTSGNNTQQGFEDWWKINKQRFINKKA